MKPLLGFVVVMTTAAISLGCSDESSSTDTTGTPPVSYEELVGKIVINEVRVTTEDWVEITNVSDSTVDISGMGLTDRNMTGAPSLPEATRFDDGTKLAPGGYLLVVANMQTAAAGVQTTCLMSGGPSTCYQASWGVSGANGDQVFLLAPSNEIIDTIIYPPNAVPDGQTYCRLPSGTGSFQACAPTPSAANAAP